MKEDSVDNKDVKAQEENKGDDQKELEGENKDKKTNDDEDNEEKVKKYKAFRYKDVYYCIKKKIKEPLRYYALDDMLEVGEEIGYFKYFDWNNKSCVTIFDKDDNKKYIFIRDEKFVIGEKIGEYNGKKKVLY